jgi:hypothetical protein
LVVCAHHVETRIGQFRTTPLAFVSLVALARCVVRCGQPISDALFIDNLRPRIASKLGFLVGKIETHGHGKYMALHVDKDILA